MTNQTCDDGSESSFQGSRRGTRKGRGMIGRPLCLWLLLPLPLSSWSPLAPKSMDDVATGAALSCSSLKSDGRKDCGCSCAPKKTPAIEQAAPALMCPHLVNVCSVYAHLSQCVWACPITLRRLHPPHTLSKALSQYSSMARLRTPSRPYPLWLAPPMVSRCK